MAKTAKKRAPAKKPAPKKKSAAKQAPARRRPLRWLFKWAFRGIAAAALLLLIAVLFYAVVNPSMTPYMRAEARRLGEIDRQWIPIEEVSPHVARSVVAAEDANFCSHWGFDMSAIRAALEEGGARGASTISQQVVKNTYLWHGRSWTRKALEALITPLVELTWSKRRILEVYLNVAEFDEGVFGIEAASHHYFRVTPDQLSAAQAARLAALLPSPKTRNAARPSASLRKRAASIMDGAATIRADGRAACFED